MTMTSSGPVRKACDTERCGGAALASFATTHSAAAFTELATRYTGLVYGVARRYTGSHEVAEEVTQNVFAVLARKAPRLHKKGVPLAAWLHRAAVLEASQAVRREAVRERMMKEFAARQEIEVSCAAIPTELKILDEALNDLPQKDQELLLARYFEGKSYRELSAETGRSEAALMQQHHRALEKLAHFFRRRGVVVSAVALAAQLSPPLASAAPAGLIASCAAGASAAAAPAGLASTFPLTLAMHTKTQLVAAGAVLCLLAGSSGFWLGRWQHDKAAPSALANFTSGTDLAHGVLTRSASSLNAAPLPIPTFAEIVAAEGLERLEKLALWLSSASSAELAAMLDSLSSLPECGLSQSELVLIIQRWVEVDRASAFVRLRMIEENAWTAFTAWGRLDPDAAWEEAQQLGRSEVAAVIRGIAERDPDLARSLVASGKKKKFRGNSAEFWVGQGLANQDPAQGWTYALDHGESAWRTVEIWMRRAPEEAIAFALDQPTLQRREQAVTELMEDLRIRYPEKVPPLFESLPEGPLKWKLFVSQAAWLAETNPEAALSWAHQATSPLARAAALQEVAHTLAHADQPERALAILRELDCNYAGNEFQDPNVINPDTPEGRASASKAAEVLQALAEQGHLDDALAVAAVVPLGPRRDQALAAVAAGWPADRVYDLSAWVMEQTIPALREAGARRLVDHLLAEPEPDFEAAARWAGTLPFEPRNGRVPLVEVMRLWQEHDPEGAAAALPTLTEPAAVPDTLEAPSVTKP